MIYVMRVVGVDKTLCLIEWKPINTSGIQRSPQVESGESDSDFITLSFIGCV